VTYRRGPRQSSILETEPHKDRVILCETCFPGGEICSKNREIILLVLLTTQSIETVSVWDPHEPLQNFKKMWIPRVGIVALQSLLSLVGIPGVVGLIALEGLLGV